MRRGMLASYTCGMAKPSIYTDEEWAAILEEECRNEQAFEERANFEEGERIVNVITGESWIAGKRPRRGGK